jgi:hypothetical protein
MPNDDAFRTLKGVDLEIRAIYYYLEKRVRTTTTMMTTRMKTTTRELTCSPNSKNSPNSAGRRRAPERGRMMSYWVWEHDDEEGFDEHDDDEDCA